MELQCLFIKVSKSRSVERIMRVEPSFLWNENMWDIKANARLIRQTQGRLVPGQVARFVVTSVEMFFSFFE